jgi:hypothetical protein
LKSAILSLIEYNMHPHPSPEKVRCLPPLLTSLYHPKNKGLDDTQLRYACQSAFEALTITNEEAEYLEESTSSCSTPHFRDGTRSVCDSIHIEQVKKILQIKSVEYRDGIKSKETGQG